MKTTWKGNKIIKGRDKNDQENKLLTGIFAI